MRLRRAFAVGLAAVVLTVPDAAPAAFPGGNGKIAFERGGQIWTMNPDGSGATQLTTAAAPSAEPEWSPDGSQIAYTRGTGDGSRIRIMNADGTGDHVLFDDWWGRSPAWSPDGRRITYFWSSSGPEPACGGCIPWYIESRHVSGEDRQHNGFGKPSANGDWGPVADIERGPIYELMWTNGTESVDRQVVGPYGWEFGDATNEAFGASFAPDSSKVAWVQQAIGSSTATLYTRGQPAGTPQPIGAGGEKVEWSPDGTRLVFDHQGDLYTSDPDGTDRLQVTSTSEAEHHADWQPVMNATHAGYIRPKQASSISVPLVVAYRPCIPINANRTHGPPLAYGSCSPPRQSSDYHTVGTPDANGAPAETVGTARFTVRPGNPATVENEADVQIRVSVNDVRCRFEIHPALCDPDGSPAGEVYSGDLDTNIQFQVTDRFHLPSQAGRDPGTLTGMWLRFRPDCDLNGTCSITTTVNALMGTGIYEGNRTVWEVGAIQIWDSERPSGPRGRPFLTQGVFIP